MGSLSNCSNSKLILRKLTAESYRIQCRQLTLQHDDCGAIDWHRCCFCPSILLATAVGAEFCSILPALRALARNDYTSKVGTKRSVMDSNPEKYLDGFDVIVNPVSLDLMVSKAEEYLVQALKGCTTLKTMNQPRGWMYYHPKGCRWQDLPPTSYAVRLQILRAFYAANIMKSLLADQHPFLY